MPGHLIIDHTMQLFIKSNEFKNLGFLLAELQSPITAPTSKIRLIPHLTLLPEVVNMKLHQSVQISANLGWILISLILLMRLMGLALTLLMLLWVLQETTKTSVALLLINTVNTILKVINLLGFLM